MLYLTKYKANEFFIFDTRDYTEICCDNEQVIEILKKDIEIIGLQLDWSTPTGIHVSPRYVQETDCIYYQGLEILRTNNSKLVGLRYKTKEDILSKEYDVIFLYKGEKILTLHHVEIHDIKTFTRNNKEYMYFIIHNVINCKEVNLKVFELKDDKAIYCEMPYYINEKSVKVKAENFRYKVCSPVHVYNSTNSHNLRVLYNKIFNRYYCYEAVEKKGGGLDTIWYKLVNIRNEKPFTNLDTEPIVYFDYDLAEIPTLVPAESELKIILAPLIARYQMLLKEILPMSFKRFRPIPHAVYSYQTLCALTFTCLLSNYETYELRKQLADKLNVLNISLQYSTGKTDDSTGYRYTLWVEVSIIEGKGSSVIVIKELTDNELDVYRRKD